MGAYQKKEKLKIAIVCFGYPNYTEVIADAATKRIVDKIKEIPEDFQFLTTVYTEKDSYEALSAFKKSSADAVIGILLSWCSPPAAMRFLIETRPLPLLLYGAGARTDGNKILQVSATGAGAPALFRPLKEAGIPYNYVFESPDEPVCFDEVKEFIRIVRAAKEVRRARIGTFGFLDMALMTTTMDTGRVRLMIGPETLSFELLDLKIRAEKLKEEEYRPFFNELDKEFDYASGKPDSSSLEHAARLTTSVWNIVREYDLDAITIKCIEGLTVLLGMTPCMIGTLLGDRVPYICENDLLGSTTNVLLQKLTGQSVPFLETYEFYKKENAVLLGVCGSMPRSCVCGRPAARSFKTEMFSGIASVSRMNTGRMTLARLYPDGAGFSMHIVTGSAENPPEWVEIGLEMPSHPSVMFKLDGSLEKVIEFISAQHFSLVYGDHAGALEKLCSLLNINVVRT